MADCYFFHGDNFLQSRQRLFEIIEELKKKGIKETVKLDGKKISLGDVKQALESQSLFAGGRLTTIENLLSSPKSKRKSEIIDYLIAMESDNLHLILWEKKEIKGAVLTKLRRHFRIEIYKMPAFIFKLLDSLKPKNHQQMLSFFHQIDEGEPEMVFYMLAGRIRQLILAKDLGEKGLERLQGWQKGRLVSQAAQFELSSLLALYHQLLEIDYQQKTGQSPLDLSSALDLFLADL